ncbi:MAG: hypothetical protein ACXVHU_08910, partial [Methanobacterium sp.]
KHIISYRGNNMNEIIDDVRRKRIRTQTILAAIWGVGNLLFSSLVFGIIFILFAVLIYVTKSLMAMYALGVVLWILALIQILNASGIINLGFTGGPAQGLELVLVAILNFAIGVIIIYRTRKLR